MSAHAPPTPQFQVEFLLTLQRLLAEGSFVATYKFALLHALADLSLVKGDDSGAPLTLATAEISGRMAELYWRQAAPYAGGAHRHELRHATGSQPAILTELLAARRDAEGSLFRFRRDQTAWSALVRRVDRVVRQMPLWKLQTVGTERLDFLYDNADGGVSIELKPGVAWWRRVEGVMRGPGSLTRVDRRAVGRRWRIRRVRARRTDPCDHPAEEGEWAGCRTSWRASRMTPPETSPISPCITRSCRTHTPLTTRTKSRIRM